MPFIVNALETLNVSHPQKTKRARSQGFIKTYLPSSNLSEGPAMGLADKNAASDHL